MLLFNQQVLSLLPLAGGALSSYTPRKWCKTYPGTSSWPSSNQWTRLNETLSGQLIQPVPPAGVCHRGQPNYDEELCAHVQEGWATSDWHTLDPVSVMTVNWSNWTCLPDPELPCSGAGYPAYVVNATAAEHVKAGVDFARENNVRLTVKGTGHDFLGRSVAPGSLSIWVHHLNGIEYHAGAFHLDGSDTIIPGDAVTAGGGTQMYDLYKATAEHNTAIVGGAAKSVGIGGYITGGGHGMLSSDHGLAADNVLQMEVVTPGGDILVANENQNADLFWALRGGGGSTFGVVTSVTLQAHPSPTIQHISFFAGTFADAPNAKEVIGWLFSQIPSLMEAGVRGYGFASPTRAVPFPIPGVPEDLAGLSASLALTNAPNGTMTALIDGLASNMTSRFNGTFTYRLGDVKYYDSWIDWYDVNYDAGSAGASIVLKSTLVGGEALTGDPQALTDAIITVTNASDSGGLQLHLLAGKGVQDAVPRGGSNAVNPGWRNALIHVLSGLSVPTFDKTTERESAKTLDAAYVPLRRLNPGLGAYINEASAYEEDYQQVFWGDNYERLLAIKRDVDPSDVFWCAPCVGNERWQERDDGQLCRIDPEISGLYS